MPFLILFGVLYILSLFSVSSSSSPGLSEDDLDGERYPNWDGRYINEIFDNDGLEDWDLDGKCEDKF